MLLPSIRYNSIKMEKTERKKEINTKTSFKSHYLIYSILAFIIGIASVILEKYVSNSFSANNFSYIYLIISGLIMSIGIIVPGVSRTIILMLMGVYSTYLSSVSYLYFPVLIPMGIGLIIGCLICMKTTKFLLDLEPYTRCSLCSPSIAREGSGVYRPARSSAASAASEAV